VNNTLDNSKVTTYKKEHPWKKVYRGKKVLGIITTREPEKLLNKINMKNAPESHDKNNIGYHIAMTIEDAIVLSKYGMEARQCTTHHPDGLFSKNLCNPIKKSESDCNRCRKIYAI
jgi:hypothetical protein